MSPRERLLRLLCPAFDSHAFRLQSRMDIHPRSLRRKPECGRLTGGFFPPRDAERRSIADLPAGDSVRRDRLVLLLRDLEGRGVAGSLAELGV